MRTCQANGLACTNTRYLSKDWSSRDEDTGTIREHIENTVNTNFMKHSSTSAHKMRYIKLKYEHETFTVYEITVCS